MTIPGDRSAVAGAPDADEIRSTVERMLASDVFRGSPQLVAFLRYVVDATLRGEADRIKGYTIAVEALGRDAAFDPQSDPIVRVEAVRLRRAINRYYATAGSAETVLIELPLGSYVPAFRRAGTSPLVRRRRVRFGRRNVGWQRVAAAVALLLAGAALEAALDAWFDFHAVFRRPTDRIAISLTPVDEPRRSTILPTVTVEPFELVGTNAATAPIARALRDKLRDALAHFDEIQVAAEPRRPDGAQGRTPPLATGYRLAGSLATDDDGSLTFRVRLIDTADARVAYTRTFDRMPRAPDSSATENSIVRELAAALAQPYGIIHANERAKSPGGSGDARYRCLMQAYDYWRDDDPALHVRARDCLERATETDPTFAVGFAALATIVLEEFFNGFSSEPGAAPPLQRALQDARRAVELKPASARAHQALLDVLFARGEYGLAVEAGEKAVMLNPFDPGIPADYGARLLSLGEQEKGARLLRTAANSIVTRPVWHETFLFLAAYLAGDATAAARHAAMITSDTYPLGLVARLLAAATRDDKPESRRLIDRLTALQPGWRSDTRQELRKFVPAESIVARLATDLARAGLGVAN